MKPIKTYQLFWLSVVCVFLFLSALGASLLASDDSDETLANRFGDVPWSHTLHAREAVANCQVCHHTSKTGDSDMQACSDCHKHRVLGDSVFPAKPNAKMEKTERKSDYADWAKEHGKDVESAHLPADRRVAFHKKCAGCHQAVGEGPTQCRGLPPVQNALRWRCIHLSNTVIMLGNRPSPAFVAISKVSLRNCPPMANGTDATNAMTA